MSSQKKHVKSAVIKNHHGSPLPLVTLGISSASAAASGSGSRSASIQDFGLVSLLIKSCVYTDDQKEADTDTSRSKPSHVWCGNHALTPESMGDRTTVNLVVTEEVFSKVTFVDRDTDLGFTEDKKSMCRFVISRCNLDANIIITD